MQTEYMNRRLARDKTYNCILYYMPKDKPTATQDKPMTTITAKQARERYKEETGK